MIAPMTPLVLRRATAADGVAIRELLVELGYAQLADAPLAGELTSTLAQILADAARDTWVAEARGLVVGLMSLSTRPHLRVAGLIVTVEELVVRETERGAGVGTALVRLAQEHTVRVGARRLELLTNRTRPVYERGFYVKCGFTEANSAVMRWTAQ